MSKTGNIRCQTKYFYPAIMKHISNLNYNLQNRNVMNIGQAIRQRRQELRLTQQALGDMSGVSVRMIKAIEGDYANPSVKIVEKLLTSLGLRLQIVENPVK